MIIKVIVAFVLGFVLEKACEALYYYADTYIRYKKNLNSIQERYQIFSSYIKMSDDEAKGLEDLSDIIDMERLRRYVKRNKRESYIMFEWFGPPSVIREILLVESEIFLAMDLSVDSRKLRVLKEEIFKLKKDLRIIMLGYNEDASFVYHS